MIPARLTIVAAATAITFLIVQPKAGAGGAGGAATDGAGIDFGAISGNQTPGGSGTGPSAGNGGSAPPSNCTYKLVDVQPGTPMFDLDGNLISTDGAGAWYEKQCGTVYYGLIFTAAGFGIPVPSPRQVAAGVLDRMNIPLPDPQISPVGDQVVNLPMWVWLDGWTTQQDSASVPGVSITVTAKPTKAVWAFGDGATLTCTGPGVAWAPTSPSEPQCGHTFRRSSANAPEGGYKVRVAVTWATSFEVVGGAGGGNLAPVTRSTEFAVQVGEVQAINTRTGGR